MKETEGFSIRLFAEKCKGKQGGGQSIADYRAKAESSA